MHGLRWFQRPRSKTKVPSRDYVGGKKLMALNPAPSCRRSCLLSLAAAVSLGFLLTRAAAAQAIQSLSPPAPMQPATRDGAEYRLLNKAVLEFQAAGRDGRPKRLVVQRRRKNEPFVRAIQRGPALVGDPVDFQHRPRRRQRRLDRPRCHAQVPFRGLARLQSHLLCGSTRISTEHRPSPPPWCCTTKARTSCPIPQTRAATIPFL